MLRNAPNTSAARNTKTKSPEGWAMTNRLNKLYLVFTIYTSPRPLISISLPRSVKIKSEIQAK